jgi:hypothetical protein
VHFGLAGPVIAQRAAVLAQAYARHPERFPHGLPTPAEPPREVWINKPKPVTVTLSGGRIVEAGPETDAHSCPRTNDRDPVRDRTTPLTRRSQLLEAVL